MSSLKDKIRAQYERIHEKRTFTLPVPGYSRFLAARYKPLPIEDNLRIYLRHGGNVEVDPDELIATAADMLINACEEVLEKRDDGSYHGLGQRWSTSFIDEWFPTEVDHEVPSVRDALVDALGSDGLMRHFNSYALETDKIAQELEDAAVGESPAATAATSSNSRPELVLPGSP